MRLMVKVGKEGVLSIRASGSRTLAANRAGAVKNSAVWKSLVTASQLLKLFSRRRLFRIGRTAAMLAACRVTSVLAGTRAHVQVNALIFIQSTITSSPLPLISFARATVNNTRTMLNLTINKPSSHLTTLPLHPLKLKPRHPVWLRAVSDG